MQSAMELVINGYRLYGQDSLLLLTPEQRCVTLECAAAASAEHPVSSFPRIVTSAPAAVFGRIIQQRERQTHTSRQTRRHTGSLTKDI